MTQYKYHIADTGETFDSVADIEKAGFKITGTDTGNKGSWIEGVEYPSIDGYHGGMRGNKEGDTIRYESYKLYSSYD